VTMRVDAAVPESAAELAEARERLDRASLLASVPLLLEAVDRLEALVEAEESAWAHCHAGYGRYRLAALAHREKREAQGHLALAAEHLKASARLLPASAEPRALLSTCLGMQIRYAPLKAPWLGERKARAMAEAERLDPDNPRVILLRGLQLWTTPRYAGGSKDAALPLFERAAERFETFVAADASGPVWGHPQALAHVGMAWLEKGDEERARDALRTALRIAPEYHWVRHVLLPRLGVVAG
jgi:tetratricopeptide (TPR) repeat protein